MIIFMDEDGTAKIPSDLTTEQLCAAIGHTYAEHQEAVWKLTDETKVLAEKVRKLYDELDGFSELISELQKRNEE
jgi:hypothetical protein